MKSEIRKLVCVVHVNHSAVALFIYYFLDTLKAFMRYSITKGVLCLFHRFSNSN